MTFFSSGIGRKSSSRSSINSYLLHPPHSSSANSFPLGSVWLYYLTGFALSFLLSLWFPFSRHPTRRFRIEIYSHGYCFLYHILNNPLSLPIHLPNFSLTNYTYDFVRPVIIRCTDNWSGIITTNADLYDHYAYRGYSSTYAGQVEKDEIFTSAQLEVLRKFIPVEDREYSLKELETLMRRTPYSSLLGAMLRFIRNGGDSNMPANYSIFTDWA